MWLNISTGVDGYGCIKVELDGGGGYRSLKVEVGGGGG